MLLLIPSRLELEGLVPEAAGEKRPWTWPGRRDRAGDAVLVATCGVGLAASGIEALALVRETGARSVLLVGLAGTLDESAAPVGSLLAGTSVSLHGIGVGEGAGHLSLTEAGGALADEAPFAGGLLPLESPESFDGPRGPLLSVTAGSAHPEDARARRTRHPRCLAEDMESWSVARAAGRAGVPCSVLRGISNLAGDRDHASWQVELAVAALRGAIDSLTGRAG